MADTGTWGHWQKNSGPGWGGAAPTESQLHDTEWNGWALGYTFVYDLGNAPKNNWGISGPTVINYGDIRFPLSGAIAPDKLLPVAYGQVRVGGAALKFGAVSGSEITNGQGTISWCVGEIGSVDALICNGSALTVFDEPSDLGYRHFTHHTGTVGDYGYVAYTSLDLWRSPVLGCQWWLYLPSGAQNAVYEWAADVHGLKLYDPRTGLTVYSNNPALIYRDILSRFGRIPDALIDDVSISAAATACDAAGFTCNVVFATKTLLRDAIAVVLQTCNGAEISANGKTGIYLDIPNAGAPVATLSEEDGDVWDLKYEWLSARNRYTRVAVAFFNQTVNKSDVTPDFDDPGIALGSVPVNALVVTAPGINTLDAAIILRDYIFNSQAITFRISGGMNATGLSLQEGQKIHLTTLKGVDADFLLVQLSSDSQGFFVFTVKPYVNVWGSTPISQAPPIVIIPPNPTTPGSDITVTGTAGERKAVASSSTVTTVYNIWQVIAYTLPSGGPALKELRVRGFRGTGAGTKTWEDMVASDVAIPLTGNEPRPDSTHLALSTEGVAKTIETLTFDAFGRLLNTADAIGPTRIIIKTATTADALSTGVTVDVAQSTTSVAGPGSSASASPLVIAPSGTATGSGGELQLQELAAGGTNVTGFGAPDALAADVRYILPNVAPALGQFLAAAALGGYPAGRSVLTWSDAVALQAATPGTAQTGHAHLSGTVIVGQLGVGTTAPDALLTLGDPLLGIGVPANEVHLARAATTAVRLGQDSTHSAFLAWVYDATAANAYAALGTFGGNNPLVLQLSGGNVGIGTPTPTLFKLQSAGHVGPDATFLYDLGATATKWRALYAAELRVETLVAQNTIATIGGRILVGPTTKLTADLASGATTIYVENNQMVSGDRVYLETAPGGMQQIEFMAVTSAATGTGPYSYTVTRNLDGTGANDWSAGDAVFNTGTTGSGFIDLYSVRGTKASTELGPTIVGNVRNSATFNDWTPRWAIGNLNGLYGYATNEYGAAFGVPSAAWLKIDPTNGIRIGFDTTVKISLDASGNAAFAGSVTAASGAIGGWTLGATALTAGSGSTTVGLDSGGTNPAFYAGSATPGSAPFRVTQAGALTATSGTMGGWTLAAGTLSGGGITLTAYASGISASKITVGTGTYAATNTEFYVDGLGRFSLKDKLTWDGTTLSITGAITATSGSFSGSVTATSGTIGGWTIGATTLSNGGAVLDSAGVLTAGTMNTSVVRVDGDDIIGMRGAAVADATNATDVITQLNALLARLRAGTPGTGHHGLIAT